MRRDEGAHACRVLPALSLRHKVIRSFDSVTKSGFSRAFKNTLHCITSSELSGCMVERYLEKVMVGQLAQGFDLPSKLGILGTLGTVLRNYSAH